MVSFISKKIYQDNLSLKEVLVAARQKKNLTLGSAAQKTNISKSYLLALEEGKYNDLPGEIYAKNFLKVYSNLLGLNFKETLSLYLTEKKIYQKTGKLQAEQNQPLKRAHWLQFLATPKIIRNSLIGLVILILLVYLGIKIKTITAPPILQIFSPTDDLVTKQELIKISGRTEKEATLLINGQQVLTDESGNFSKIIDLQKGTNIVRISVQKKHGQETVVYRKIVVAEENFDN